MSRNGPSAWGNANRNGPPAFGNPPSFPTYIASLLEMADSRPDSATTSPAIRGEEMSMHKTPLTELERDNYILAAEVRRLRDEVKRLTGSVDQASAWQEAIEDIASYMSVGVEGCDPVEAVARIKKASDDFVRVAVQRAELAEKALKEAQEQEPVLCHAAFSNGDGTYSYDYVKWPLRPHEKPVRPVDRFFYARPVPAAPAVAVPAVPDQFCDVTKLIVPQEWRDVITELADDLSIELDMRYQSRSHYPSELRKYENEMQPVYRARALLQSTGDQK